MPRICFFLGIAIYMYPGDHGVPHIHAIYGEYNFKLTIEDLELLDGHPPGKVRQRVEDWIRLRRKELLDNWARCKRMESPEQVAPPEK